MEGSKIYKRKLKREIRCPLKYGLDIFGGKWKSRILCVLAAKAQLREEIGNITDPVLVAGRELSRQPGLYADFLGGKREADAWKL